MTTYTYNASGSDPFPTATFNGTGGDDTLDAHWIGSAYAGDGLLTDFTDNGDGTFTARYYDLHGNSVTISGIENVHIYADNRYEDRYGHLQSEGGYNDVIRTGGGDDVIFTDAATDVIDVGKGVDQVDGGDGIDFISKDLSDVTTDISWDVTTNTYSGPGSFTNLEYFITLQTGSGDDTIVTGGPGNAPNLPSGAGGGTGGNETVSTGAGNDTVTVSQGIDTIDMGARP